VEEAFAYQIKLTFSIPYISSADCLTPSLISAK